MFINTRETHSALGPALQAAFKLMSPTGGRVSVFQTQLPSLGAGLLQSREDPNQRSSTKVLYVECLDHNHGRSLSPQSQVICVLVIASSAVINSQEELKPRFLYLGVRCILLLTQLAAINLRSARDEHWVWWYPGTHLTSRPAAPLASFALIPTH